MEITFPTAAEVAELFADNAHRYPDKAPAVVAGDRGVRQKLPLILGVPSGTIDVGDKRTASSAWSDACAATYGIKEFDEDALVRDCLLYPPPAVWSSWVDRWPALAEAVMPVLRGKLGWSRAALLEPPFGYEPSAAIAAVLEQNPRAVLRTVTLQKQDVAVVLTAPRTAVWKLFRDAMRKKDASHWELSRQFALSVILAVEGVESPDVLVKHWPGMALALGHVAAGLAGNSADVELGEW